MYSVYTYIWPLVTKRRRKMGRAFLFNLCLEQTKYTLTRFENYTSNGEYNYIICGTRITTHKNLTIQYQYNNYLLCILYHIICI